MNPALLFLAEAAKKYFVLTPAPANRSPSLTPAELNTDYFDPSTPSVTSGNISQWDVISATGSFQGLPTAPRGNSMTAMKGTMAFNTVQGGFSESVYSTDPNETYLSMLTKMDGLMQARMGLSIGNDMDDCENPLIPQFIRVEDELIKRDAITVSEAKIRPSFFAQTGLTPGNQKVRKQNLDTELGWRIGYRSGGSRQTAFICHHGVPIFAFSQGINSAGAIFLTQFLREARPNGSWLTMFRNYIRFLYNSRLGFRTITGDWNNPDGSPGSYSTPSSVFYNTGLQMVELQWLTAQPDWGSISPSILPQKPANWPNVGAICRLQVRSWKGFQVLQGRWAAQVVQPQTGFTFALRIIRTCRQPLVANMPKVSPIAWAYWYPGQVLTGGSGTLTDANADIAGSLVFIESKKLGKNFEESRGRQRNRPT